MDFREGQTLCKEERGTVIIKVRRFSEVSIHKPEAEPSGLIDYDVSRYDSNEDYAVKVYPNGCDSSTEGQVSLEFEYVHGLTPYLIHMWTISHFDLTCWIAVVDAEGCRRFCQSYVYTFDPTQGKLPKFLVDNFVSRRFLLASADELLPDDTLTLQVDVVVREHHAQGRLNDKYFFEWVTGSCKSEKDQEGQSYIGLPLNSFLARYLATESSYVEGLNAWNRLQSPGSPGSVWEMPSEEYSNFVLMLSIVWCRKVQSITLRFSFQEIIDVYAWAYYYVIESVIDTCRRWLGLVCRTREQASRIIRLANSTYDDKRRKIGVKAYKRETGGGGSGGSYPREEDGEWTYNVEEYPNSGICFLFKLRRHLRSTASEIPEIPNEMSSCYL